MNIDVRKEIEKNSYVTSVADLEKRGRRKVKVIKTSTIRELINQAVENVRLAGNLGGDKDAAIGKTKEEFDRLLRSTQEDKQALTQLEETIQQYKALITDLNSRIKYQEDELEQLRAAGATGASDEPAVDAEEIAAKDARIAELERDLAAETESVEAARSKLTEKNAEIESLRDGGTKIKELEAELALAKQVSEAKGAEMHDLEAAAARADALEAELDRAKSAVEEVDALRAQLSDATAKAGRVDELEASLERANADSGRVKELETALLESQREVSKAEESGAQAAEVSAKAAELAATVEELNAKVEALTAQVGEAEARATKAETALQEAEGKTAKAESGVQDMESQLATAQRELSAARGELDNLRVDAQRSVELDSGLKDALEHIEQLKAMNAELDKKCESLSEESEKFERDSADQITRMNEVLLRQEKELESAREAVSDADENKTKVISLTAELKALRETQPAASSLLEELRKMREDFKSLEDRNRDLEAKAAQAPSADTSNLESMLENKMSQISSELSAKLANLKHGATAGTEPEDIKSAIQQIFSHDLDAEVDSNLGEVEVKEKKSSGIAGNLERLKNLGRKKD